MNPRERQMVIIIGGLVGLWAAYKAVDLMLISPIASANTEIVKRRDEYEDARKKRERLPEIAKEWQGVTRRTFSFDARDAQNMFSDQLKQLATKHNLQKTSFEPRTPQKLNSKSDIVAVALRINGEGTLDQITGFLADIYRLPTLCVIHKLRMSPMKTMGGGDELKISELVVETLVAPQVANAVECVSQRLRGTTTMPADPKDAPPSLRRGLPSEAEFALLSKRNIFKAYEPPPQFAVTIDNQDLKDVGIELRFTWKGQPATSQPAVSVAGKSRKDMAPGAGDKVEVTAKYADGKSFGPTTLTWAEGKPAVLTVPSHTPPPPPTKFAYQVRNDGEEPVDVEVVVTKESKPKTWPLMKVDKKKSIDLEFEGQTLTLTGIYSDGTRAAPGTYQVATANTGTYVIPPKPAVPVKPPPVEIASLPKPDPDLQVTALLSYPEAQELVALNTKTKRRQVFTRGTQLDGGTLVAVNTLGGVVRMPGDLFFLYPLGRRFPERVQLDAQDEAEVASAVERWNRQ